ncbi:signal peptidase I [Paenibacillus athensensis]|uniref:Signal peptidase I n=1 Tax=Paenibacillus athensensis TaxID=1967502 RepID=A0A4Y8PY89_9BACL|nr:signal peptidase I [Paenibacillus athensensis]MCD1257849.1 signal peptidase I [Paenibacillus athensensis]
MEHKDQDEQKADAPRPSEVLKKEGWEWVKALGIAAVLVLIIRWWLFTPFIVDGISMEPNFFTGERLIVNKILYDIRKPKRDEVIVFLAPEGKDYIKRVVALPGETVRVEGDHVYVNGTELDQPYLKEAIEQAHQDGRNYNDKDFPETKVPEGAVFVMGDNRSHSSDSREPSVGFATYKQIAGRAEFIFWPLNKLGFIHF